MSDLWIDGDGAGFDAHGNPLAPDGKPAPQDGDATGCPAWWPPYTQDPESAE